MAIQPDIEERDLGDPDPLDTPELRIWQEHDWTAQEVQFVSEVLSHGIAARAYLAAFVSEPTPKQKIMASSNGNRLLQKPHIKGYVDFIRAQLVESMVMSADEVLSELSKLGRSNMADFTVVQENGEPVPDLSGLTRAQWAAVQELTIDVYTVAAGPNQGREVKSMKFKLAPKLPALELLGKKHKLFTDVIEDGRITDLADTVRTRRQQRIAKARAKIGTKGDDEGGETDGTTGAA